MELLHQAPLDPLLRQSFRRALIEGPPSGLELDADALCSLLLSLDADALPLPRLLFTGLGPARAPLFRGLGAELLLVQWQAGQGTGICDLGDSALAVRPLRGSLELQIYQPTGRRAARAHHVLHVAPGQLAGVPRGALHALVAREESVSLHLCAPPIVEATIYRLAAPAHRS